MSTHFIKDGKSVSVSATNPLPVSTSDGDSLDSSVVIPRGGISGVTSINKFGHNIDVDTGTVPETIWDGPTALWVPPTKARVHAVASSSIQDAGTLVSSGTFTDTSTTKVIDSAATFVTDSVAVGDSVLDTTNHSEHSYVVSVDSETQLTVEELHHNGSFPLGNTYSVVTTAGTGAAFVHIKNGIDSTKGFNQEFIILNGTTSVNTTMSFYRINRAHIGVCGSNDANVGNITLTAATDATVTAHIAANEGQTLMAVYTVPAGYEAFMTGVWATISKDATKAATAEIALYSTPYALDAPLGRRVETVFGLNSLGTGAFYKPFEPYRKFEAQTDLEMRVIDVSVNDTQLSGGFDIILVRDDV